MYANLLPNMAKRWSLMTTSERSWIIVQAHARSCGVPSMTLGPWLIMARDDMGRSPNRPDSPSRTGMLEQAPPAAGAGMALVYWRATCGVVVLLCLLCLSRPVKSSTFVAGLDDPLVMETSHKEHQGPIRAQHSVNLAAHLVREPLPGISDPWPPDLGSVSCAVAVSTSHLPGIMSHLGSVCLCRRVLLKGER
jgi:hypothetical protein